MELFSDIYEVRILFSIHAPSILDLSQYRCFAGYLLTMEWQDLDPILEKLLYSWESQLLLSQPTLDVVISTKLVNKNAKRMNSMIPA